MKITATTIAATAATTATFAALSALQPFSPSALCSDAPRPNTARPNILFILTDDLGYGDIGAFFQNARRADGQPAHKTPNLDRMAAEGACLTQHYCAAPVSAPSRASFLSGLSQGHANVRDNQFDKALADNHTVATVLKQAGYTTVAIGKWGLHGSGEPKDLSLVAANNKLTDWPAHPLHRGFDYYYGYLRHVDGHEHYPKEMPYFTDEKKTRGLLRVWDNHTDVTAGLDKCYTADLWTARAKKWITDHEKTAPAQPFFMYLAYDTPHAVLELPTQAYPAGGGLNGGIQWLGAPGRMINTASGTPDSYMHPDYASATYTRDGKQLPWPEVNKRYATSIRRIDDAVGDLFQLLKDLGIDQNTIVVFASDNGPSVESYLEDYIPDGAITPQFFASYGPFDGIKRDEWEGGLRVPAIARWPGHIPAGTTDLQPCAMFDWLPTFADAAGLPAAPANMDGISLLPALTGAGQSAPRDYLYFEYFVQGRTPKFPEFEPAHRDRVRNQMQAIRLGDLMAVRYNVKSWQDNFEIYNIIADPKEAHDLGAAPANAALQKRLKDLSLQARRPLADAPRPYDKAPMPALAREQLPAKTAPGLAWSLYEGNFPWVPNVAALAAKQQGAAPAPDVSPVSGQPNAALRFTGYLDVPADGLYTFVLTTDGGAVMRLHDATIIDADYGYKSGAEKTAQVLLKAGKHPITLTYRASGAGAPALSLKWNADTVVAATQVAGVFDGAACQPIPAPAFSH